MRKFILLSLVLSSLPLQAHPTIYRNETCYKNVVQEEYIPPHRSHYGEGYINRYYNKVEIPCNVGHHHSHIQEPVAYQKNTKCTGNTTVGALLGGGLAASLSKKDAYGWSVPLGAVLGGSVGHSACR